MGKYFLKKSYEFANREEKTKNTTETQFLIGSLTKSFVAVSVLQLEEYGLLDLNEPISTYIPKLNYKSGDDNELN